MSQEHDKPSSDETPIQGGVHSEASPFEPGYQPESLPKITVPDLADDAQGLSAEALAQVPTLTDLVDEDPSHALPDATEPDVAVADSADAQASQEVVHEVDAEAPEQIQDTPVQADTWVEELHVRMGRLTDDIHSLNARLDRLEERNKTKV